MPPRSAGAHADPWERAPREILDVAVHRHERLPRLLLLLGEEASEVRTPSEVITAEEPLDDCGIPRLLHRVGPERRRVDHPCRLAVSGDRRVFIAPPDRDGYEPSIFRRQRPYGIGLAHSLVPAMSGLTVDQLTELLLDVVAADDAHAALREKQDLLTSERVVALASGGGHWAPDVDHLSHVGLRGSAGRPHCLPDAERGRHGWSRLAHPRPHALWRA